MEKLALTPEDVAAEPVGVHAAEFIGIPEWCRRVGCSRESGYRAARRNEIPGLFRIGRLKRINWGVFVSAAASSRAGAAGTIER
jgi:predicted DNA-binding transcriptional regulator AlpA